MYTDSDTQAAGVGVGVRTRVAYEAVHCKTIQQGYMFTFQHHA